MDYQKQVFGLIEALTGQKNILTIPVAFIEYTGSRDAALFLSQLLYWTSKSKNDGWIFKTYQEWEEEIHMTEYEIRKARKALEKLGILETTVKKAYGNPTVHYRIKRDKFSVSFLKNLKERNLKIYSNEPLKIAESLTETTPEITADIYKDYTPYQEIVNLYNETCTSLPKVVRTTDNRKTHIKARWKEYNNDIEIFKTLFIKAEQSDFLTHRKPNDRNWKADFDWLINQQNMAKVLEDKYINKEEPKKPQQQSYPYQGQLDPETLALYENSGD